jgi:uncharacterized membrane protein
MTTQAIPRKRIYSIDILRGIIMIIMALDHVRDYFHITANTDSPTNLATTTAELFFTRWITHFCAPVFVFLAGCSAYLSGLKKTKKEQAIFLVKRGCWLVLVEIFIVTLGWTFNPFYNIIILQVIWAIGISMILLGLFIQFPYPVILLTGACIICFHNLLDYPEAAAHGQVGLLWQFAHHGFFTPVKIFGPHSFFIIYAFLPWTGIMFLGYGFGRLFENGVAPYRRRRYLVTIGIGMLAGFVLLRFLNGYGDGSPWSVQKNPVFTFLSFINVSKYPPSLCYILMTLGIGILALGFLEKAAPDRFRISMVFGRVPFFYYVLHLYLIHLLTVIVFFAEQYSAKDIPPQHTPFFFRPDHFGFGLFGVYAIWILLIVMLYPVCYWYNRYKSTHHQWWLSYL